MKKNKPIIDYNIKNWQDSMCVCVLNECKLDSSIGIMYNVQSNSARFIYTLSGIEPKSIDEISNDILEKNQNTEHNNSQINNVDIELMSILENKTTYDKTSTLTNSDTMASMANSTQSHIKNIINTTKHRRQRYCKLNSNYYLLKAPRSDEKIRYTESDMYSIVRTVLFMYCYEMSPNESLNEIINTGEISFDLNQTPNHIKLMNISTMVQLLDSLFGDNFSYVVSRVLIKCLDEYNHLWRFYPYRSKIIFPSARDFVKLARFMNITTFKYSKVTQFMLNNSMDHKVPLQNNIKLLK
ncbi:GrBNV gp61-like protein-like protein [Mauternbach virus]|uniref:GrBNV gp61-like protein-like protein n=1 Tax=Mauternbach virus TaxID=2486603 RepID=A0A3G3E896_9VIRU|nr:GrBNV gp61-like protein-like protein [Mauternbach virus]AYP97944.1 GrBNV gp61-like protein-like protein [Mauternbach virus]